MSGPRVLHVIADAQLGGAQMYLIELVREQVQREDDIAILSGGRGPLEKQYAEVAPRYHRTPWLRREGGLHDPIAAAIVGGRARGFDIVHAHGSKALTATVLSKPLHQRPVLWSGHGYDSAHADFSPTARVMLDQMKRLLVRGADLG